MTQDVPGGHRRSAGTPEPRRPELVDLYELLEISPHASLEVIQAAYRVLVRTYHPDLNASVDAARRIRQLNAAYEVLSHPPERARYDLECLRARRFERLIDPGNNSGSGAKVPMAGRTRSLPARPSAAQQRRGDERPGLLNGAAMVGLLVVATLAAILLALFVMGFDAPADYNSIFDRPTAELTGY